MTNRNIHPQTILDVRTLNSAVIGSDHKLLLAKLRLKIQGCTNTNKNAHKSQSEQRFNVESLWNESTKRLYQVRLKEKVEKEQINEEDNV